MENFLSAFWKVTCAGFLAWHVSMVHNYRSQFSRIINKSSYEGLVQTIERKLKELDASPSSLGENLKGRSPGA